MGSFEASMKATLPKDEEQVLTADVRFWVVNVQFDQEIAADQSTLDVRGLTNDFRIEIKDINRRSTTIAILPAKQDLPVKVVEPKGMLEIKVLRSTTHKEP
jgi:acetolactate synthase small subunit